MIYANRMYETHSAHVQAKRAHEVREHTAKLMEDFEQGKVDAEYVRINWYKIDRS